MQAVLSPSLKIKNLQLRGMRDFSQGHAAHEWSEENYLLQVWPVDQQLQHPLGIHWKCRFSSHTSNLRNPNPLNCLTCMFTFEHLAQHWRSFSLFSGGSQTWVVKGITWDHCRAISRPPPSRGPDSAGLGWGPGIAFSNSTGGSEVGGLRTTL